MATTYPLGGDVCWERYEYVESVGAFSRLLKRIKARILRANGCVGGLLFDR